MASWFCKCGAENDIGEVSCPFCGSSSNDALSTIEFAALRNERAKRAAKKRSLSTRVRKLFSPGYATGTCVIGILLIIVTVVYVIPFLQKLPFRGYIPEYMVVESSLRTPESPYVRGKIIPINVTEKQVDDLWFKLPDALRASNPGEVGTVLLIDCASEVAGYYVPEEGEPGKSNTLGRQWRCSTDLLDERSHHILDHRYFVGEHPPEKIDSNSLFDVSGPKPYGDMISYLDNLPRQ
jgi:hypothetical protein